MAKRQSSLHMWLKDVPSKAARVRKNENENEDNKEDSFSEMESSTMSEADKAETTDDFPYCISEAIPSNCTV